MGNPRVFIGGISVGGEAAGANGDKESSNVSRARCCATRETTGGTAAEALDNAVSGERTRSGWIDADVTDAQAMEMLRGVCSGVRPCLSRRGYRFVKRAFDIAASGVAIGLLFVPGVLLSAAICIKSPGAGPFYSQARVGRVRRDGTYRFFRMWKFRSMVPHADEMLDELKERNEADGPLFKIKDDPRVISGVGSFIRKHSIDELPQLVNVFLGDMSLVGPRPALPKEVVQYDAYAMHRLAVKPGCGGAWQVSGRSDSTFEEMVELDIDYIERRSAGFDLALIFETLRSMLTGRGAY